MADDQLTLNVTARDNASATLRKVGAETRGLGLAGAKAAGPMETLGKVTGGLVSPATLAFGAVFAGGAVLVGATEAASSLNEQLTASQAVFRESAGEVQAFAEEAENIGLSERAALEASNALGNMFNSTGLARSESAKMSTTMVQLATDMASFSDQDPEEMLLRLRSGLAGEAEPLRKFGILLSEASVKAFAYKNGIAEVGAELTETEKVQARYGFILENTKDQQGDFERTSGSLANQQRHLTAEIENLGAKIGAFMQGPGATFIGWLAGVVEGAGRAAESLGDLWRVISLGTPAVDEIDREFEEAFGFKFPQTIEEGMETSADRAVAGAAQVNKRIKAGIDKAAATVGKFPKLAADEMLANQFHLQDATDELKAFMDAALTPKEERRRAQGFLNSKAYARGLASGNPLVRRKAEELGEAAEDVLADATAKAAGAKLAETYANGIDGAAWNATQAAARMAAGVAGFLEFRESPPYTKVRRIGREVARVYGESINQGMDKVRVPALPGMGGAMGGGGFGGGGGNVIINSYFPPTPAQADEIARRLFPSMERQRKRQH